MVRARVFFRLFLFISQRSMAALNIGVGRAIAQKALLPECRSSIVASLFMGVYILFTGSTLQVRALIWLHGYALQRTTTIYLCREKPL